MTSLADLSWPVHTARLTIRPATAGDVDAIWAHRGDPGVSDWLPRTFTERDAFADYLLQPIRLPHTLVAERDGTVVGDLMLRVDDAWGQYGTDEATHGSLAELGWVLHPDHAGQGLGSEAAAALLRLSFVELGLRRVTAQCFADNIPSWRIMERLGMRRERHGVRDARHRSRGWLDTVEYALLREEWEAGASS